MASSRWCCIALVALAVMAYDASAQRQLKQPQQIFLQKPRSASASPILVGQTQQKLAWPTARLPAKASLQRCKVEKDVRVTCGSPRITVAQCEAINCCFDGRSCYYGKTVTVQCTKDGQFVVVVARNSTLPPLDLDSISLLRGKDQTCSPVGTNAAFIAFQFPITECGTIMVENASYVIYENHMLSSYEVQDGPRGSINRDGHFQLLFQCQYSSTAARAMIVEVDTVPPPAPPAAVERVRMELRLASGLCFTKACVEEEEAYRSFYSAAAYPVIKVLRQPVYAEVRVLEMDPDLVLTLEHCWATTNAYAFSLPRWELLVDGFVNLPYSSECEAFPPFWTPEEFCLLASLSDARTRCPFPMHEAAFTVRRADQASLSNAGSLLRPLEWRKWLRIFEISEYFSEFVVGGISGS